MKTNIKMAKCINNPNQVLVKEVKGHSKVIFNILCLET